MQTKKFGGLGFVDSRIRNICLLSKWIYKLESGVNDLSCNLLHRKYMGDGGFYQSREVGGSQFWRGLHSVKAWFKKGSSYTVGNGKMYFFGWMFGWGIAPRGACSLTFLSAAIRKILRWLRR